MNGCELILRLRPHTRREDRVVALPLAFRLVESDVGVRHQLARIGVRPVPDPYSDARMLLNVGTGDEEGIGQRVEQSSGDPRRLFG